MADEMADVVSSYAKSLTLWIGRHKQAMQQVRDLENEVMGLHQTLCALVAQAGGEVVLSQKARVEIPPILAVYEELSDGSLHLSVRSE